MNEERDHPFAFMGMVVAVLGALSASRTPAKGSKKEEVPGILTPAPSQGSEPKFPASVQASPAPEA